MKIFKSKGFWLGFAHCLIIAAGATASVMYPSSAVPIMSGTSALNAVLASPVMSK